MNNWEQFYDGSRKFEFVARATKMPIDQVNFILCQLCAFFMAFVLRRTLPPHSYKQSSSSDDATHYYSAATRTHQRHNFTLFSGLVITYFCFGKQVLLAVALGLLCYCVLLMAPPALVHKITLTLCMGLLSATHIYRQTLQQATFVIDITGPLMLMVQRASTVAFSLHDGLTKPPSKMTSMQAKHALSECPTAVEYFGYIFSFQSILAGPFLMFKEYREYIEGDDQFAKAVVLHRSIEQAKSQQLLKQTTTCPNNNDGAAAATAPPSDCITTFSPKPLNPTSVAVKKLLLGALLAVSTVLLASRFKVARVTEPEFVNLSFLGKVMTVLVATTLARHLYYTAWLFADAVCNMGGLGYAGTDAQGNHQWNGASNVDIWNVEFGSSLKTTLDAWNTKTVVWLRYTAYERLSPKLQVVGTYFLSSTWHGFYPGYYCSFLLGALGTYGARAFRRCVRPRVVALQGGETGFIMNGYHLLTWVATRLHLSYSTFSFVLLTLHPTLAVYAQLYYFMHVLCVLSIVLLPHFTPRVKKVKAQEEEVSAPLHSNESVAKVDTSTSDAAQCASEAPSKQKEL